MSSTNFEFNELKKNIENEFKLLMQNIEILEYNSAKKVGYTYYGRYHNTIIRKKLVDYLINGIDYQEALEFLNVEFNLSQNIIDNVIKVQFDIFKRRKLAQKIFCARLLSSKGFKTKDLANILEVTPATVRNYLNNHLLSN